MSEDYFSSKIENNEVTPNSEDNDYSQLIIKLKEICTNIALLEKKII